MDVLSMSLFRVDSLVVGEHGHAGESSRALALAPVTVAHTETFVMGPEAGIEEPTGVSENLGPR